MKQRSILFSASMVRAILAGTKTQTRRVVKLPANAKHVQYWTPPSGKSEPGWADPGVNYWTPDPNGETDSNHLDRCPYGQPGDRLWVREAFRFLDSFDGDSPATVGERCLAANYPKPWAPTQYEADGWRDNWMHVGTPRSAPGSPTPGKLRPGIHMPRWASRILLEITAVRVERLNEISEADCIAEGASGGHGAIPSYSYNATPEEHYRHIWESINGPGSWAANPWVWVVEFRKIKP